MNAGKLFSRRRAVLVLLACAGLAACGRKPAEISVSPQKLTIYGLGKKKTVKADVLDKKSRPLPEARVKWESTKPSVVVVDGDGILKSVSAGKTTVTVSCEKVPPVAILVEVFDVASITVSPNRVTLVGARGTSSQFAADVKDVKGNILAIKPQWNVGDPKIAKVDPGGSVTALAEGRTTITASLDDVLGVADVRTLFREIQSFEMTPTTIILRTGETQRMSVSVRDASGALIEDAALLWSTSDPKTAICSNGIVQAVGRGTATISAAAGSKVLTATVLVN